MTDQIQLPLADEVADMPDILVVWGGTAAIAGVIELDPESEVLMATRSRRTSRWPGDRLITTCPTEAVDFLRSTEHDPAGSRRRRS